LPLGATATPEGASVFWLSAVSCARLVGARGSEKVSTWTEVIILVLKRLARASAIRGLYAPGSQPGLQVVEALLELSRQMAMTTARRNRRMLFRQRAVLRVRPARGTVRPVLVGACHIAPPLALRAYRDLGHLLHTLRYPTRSRT
jgi:hypothetical protein